MTSGLANSSLWDKLVPPTVCVKWSQNTATPTHSHSAHGCFHDSAAEASRRNRDSMAHEAEHTCHLVLHRKRQLLPESSCQETHPHSPFPQNITFYQYRGPYYLFIEYVCIYKGDTIYNVT